MLTSWKEIAAFFNRTVRTVQRWEREEGLPVHRHNHNQRSSVYAHAEELSAWWQQHGDAADADGNPEPAASAVDTPAIAPQRSATAIWSAILAVSAFVAVAAWLGRAAKSHEAPPYRVQRLSAPAGGNTILARSLADINGDGLADAVLGVMGGGSHVDIYFGRSQTVGGAAADSRVTTTLDAELVAGAVGDVDGDSLPDLMINALMREPSSYGKTGPSFLVRGRNAWPATLEVPRDADATFVVDLPSDIRLDSCLGSGPFDLNGDGVGDIVFGAGDFSPPGRPSAGGLFVFFGRRDWPRRIDVRAQADVTVYGSRTGEGMKSSCDTGDFNGDGKPDLAVAAGETTLWGCKAGAGACTCWQDARPGRQSSKPTTIRCCEPWARSPGRA